MCYVNAPYLLALRGRAPLPGARVLPSLCATLEHVNPEGAAMRLLAVIAFALAIASGPALAQTGKATLKNADGEEVGTAELSQLPAGV